MSLAVMTIPDDPRHLPGWLEEQMLGLRLGDLVAELAAVHQAAVPRETVRDFLGDSLPAVLRDGLGVLPADRLRGLLRQPYYLIELQEVVLEQGGPDWTDRPISSQMQEQLDRDWERIRPLLDPVSSAARNQWYRSPWLVSLATAAAVLLAVWAGLTGSGLLKSPEKPYQPLARGWLKPGALAQDGDTSAYYARLAAGARDYLTQPPDDPTEVARWIGEIRQGCAALQMAEHQPLSADQRNDLRTRCRKWSDQLDQQLAALEKPDRDVAAVRVEVKVTVGKLVEFLDGQAKANRPA